MAQKERRVKKEAETGALCLRALPVATDTGREARTKSSLRASRSNGPASALIPGFWPPDCGKINVCCAKPPGRVNLSPQPWETSTPRSRKTEEAGRSEAILLSPPPWAAAKGISGFLTDIEAGVLSPAAQMAGEHHSNTGMMQHRVRGHKGQRGK